VAETAARVTREVGQNLEETSRRAGEAVVRVARDAAETIEHAAGGATRTVADGTRAAGETLADTSNGAGEAGGQAARDAAGAIADTSDSATEAVGRFARDAAESLADASDAAAEAGGQVARDAVETPARTSHEVAGAARDVVHNTVEAVDAGSDERPSTVAPDYSGDASGVETAAAGRSNAERAEGSTGRRVSPEGTRDSQGAIATGVPDLTTAGRPDGGVVAGGPGPRATAAPDPAGVSGGSVASSRRVTAVPGAPIPDRSGAIQQPSQSPLSSLHIKVTGEVVSLTQPVDDNVATQAGESGAAVERSWSPGWLPFTGIYLVALLALAGALVVGGGAIDRLRRKVALG
jgi:hypothetical protein